MNPNAMVGTAPRRLMQDVMPPYSPSTAQPAPGASQPMPTMSAPSAPTPTPTQSVPEPAPTAAVQSPPAVQPMFPVVAEASPTQVPVQNAVPASTAQVPTAKSTPRQVDAPAVPAKTRTNWLIIVFAVAVTAGLAFAAYTALKPH